MKKNFKTVGIVIRKVDFNEADRIVTVLTEDFGKIDCIAKGARRMKSKFCGRLELFNQVSLTCFWGKSLAYINEVELINALAETKSLDRHRVGFYMAELTNKLIQPEQDLAGSYKLLKDVLFILENTSEYEVVLQCYLIKLLTLSGFLPVWNRCSICNSELDIKNPIKISNIDNHVLCSSCSTDEDKLVESHMIKWINFMQNYPISQSIHVKISPKDRRYVQQWLSGILNSLLSSPLRSEAFFMAGV